MIFDTINVAIRKIFHDIDHLFYGMKYPFLILWKFDLNTINNLKNAMLEINKILELKKRKVDT